MPSFPDLTTFAHHSTASALAALVDRHSRADTAASWCVIDGTCGNGHDTLFLATTLASFPFAPQHTWKIVACDIQPQALQTTKKRLIDAGFSDAAMFISEGHEHLTDVLTSFSHVAAAIYNLGYLPGSDKRITTQADTTLASFQQVAGVLMPGGVLVVHSYGGHAGGAAESAAVHAWFAGLCAESWQVARYDICNKPRNPEAVYVAERRVR